MVAIYEAYTGVINPPGTQPSLTISQIWAGLERKVRHGEEFVPVITSTDVIEESVEDTTQNPVVVREVVFTEGFGPGWAWTDEAREKGKAGRVRERCVLTPLAGNSQCKVHFYLQDGSVVQNVVSQGAEGDLYMTYVFEWLRPEIDPNDTAKVKETRDFYKAGAKMAVEQSLDAIRKMVKDGRITS